MAPNLFLVMVVWKFIHGWRAPQPAKDKKPTLLIVIFPVFTIGLHVHCKLISRFKQRWVTSEWLGHGDDEVQRADACTLHAWYTKLNRYKLRYSTKPQISIRCSEILTTNIYIFSRYRWSWYVGKNDTTDCARKRWCQPESITATNLHIHHGCVHRFDRMYMVYRARLQHNVINGRFTSVKNQDQQWQSSALEHRNARCETIATSSWIREDRLSICVERRKDIEGPEQSDYGDPYGFRCEILARTSTDTEFWLVVKRSKAKQLAVCQIRMRNVPRWATQGLELSHPWEENALAWTQKVQGTSIRRGGDSRHSRKWWCRLQYGIPCTRRHS